MLSDLGDNFFLLLTDASATLTYAAINIHELFTSYCTEELTWIQGKSMLTEVFIRNFKVVDILDDRASASCCDEDG